MTVELATMKPLGDLRPEISVFRQLNESGGPDFSSKNPTQSTGFMKCAIHSLSSCLVMALLPVDIFAGPPISYNDLHKQPVETISDKIHITDMLTTHGNAATDGYVYILDRMPANWEYAGIISKVKVGLIGFKAKLNRYELYAKKTELGLPYYHLRKQAAECDVPGRCGGSAGFVCV